VRACFDIAEADRRLRETLRMEPAERARAFDALRSGWPARREFHVRPVGIDDPDAGRTEILRALGFRVSALASAGGTPR
jgi:erythronate-4-phosphate dehydrogenase